MGAWVGAWGGGCGGGVGVADVPDAMIQEEQNRNVLSEAGMAVNLETQARSPEVEFPPSGSFRRKKNRAHSFICVVQRLSFLLLLSVHLYPPSPDIPFTVHR